MRSPRSPPACRRSAANPSIVEVDLNPVIADTDGAVIVDALIRVAAPADEETTKA